ncbi:MAG: aquaporin family protein [Planctomycetes bacterium]|nr:aquaporin family protein [Planctomycetota bacterium]
MKPFWGELIGTMILVVLGDGVVANVLLARTKGNNAGWIVVSAGWGLAVAIAVYLVNVVSGGHLNPAVTVAMATLGKLLWADVPVYVAAQMLGAFLGAVLVWLAYWPHWVATEDQNAKLAVFCTAPAIRRMCANFLCELIGTFVLVLGVLAILRPDNLRPGTGLALGIGPLLVGLLVWSIGLSLGGPTGYAINPARDLGPRLAHALLPIAGKGPSDWAYAWVPVLGPIAGGVLGAKFFQWCW